MQFDQTLNNGQSDSKTSFGTIDGSIALRKQVKDPGQHFFLDSDACVAHPDDDIAHLPRCRQSNSPARIGVLCGIREQIDQDLLQSQWIGLEAKLACRQRYTYFVLAIFKN